MTGSDQAAYPPSTRAWKTVIVLSLLFVLALLDRNIINILAIPIQTDLGLTDFQLSLLLGLAFAFFYSVLGLPLGWAIDRYPRRLVIFCCVMFWSISTALTGFAGSFAVFFAARSGVGAGEAGLAPGAHSMISDSFPPQRLALPMSIYSLGSKGGQALSLLLGGGLVALVGSTTLYTLPIIDVVLKGWQLIFILVGLPGALIALLIFTVPEPPRRHDKADPAVAVGYRAYFAFARRHWRFFVSHHLGTMLFLATAVAVNSWMPVYLQRHHGLSAGASGAWLGGAMLLIVMVAMPVHGYLADRFFRRGATDAHLRYLIYVALLSLPIGISAFLVDDAKASVALIALFIGGIAGYSALPVAALQTLAPGNMRGKSSSVLLLVNALGGFALGPVIVASITDFVFKDPNKVGYALALTLLILVTAAALCFSLSLRPLRTALSEKHADGPLPLRVDPKGG